MYEEVDKLKEEERRTVVAEPEDKSSGLFFGLILIGLGIFFLARNFFGFAMFDNWWALFILIPAAGSFSRAWSQYRATGSWRGAAGRSLTGGLLITAIALNFLFDLDIGRYWPVLLIILGFSLLLQRE